ncbi:uncharacterized protein HD556DRAFT_367778 [Suillus plorans]|uniref:Uncharacterized protein n=1 Tax=Suillus plorans TaxID=116603 RepID=A0A9P7DIB6_9AGAM|nr:uncharacterized protein HD556DRAFT_367778 [Suillus plorans]KAG1795677.1 hypothetical protein HD556DRAFT_367778 [Suillus plorans]
MHGSRCEPTAGIDSITSAAPTETNSSLQLIQDTGILWNSCPNVHVLHGALITSFGVIRSNRAQSVGTGPPFWLAYWFILAVGCTYYLLPTV